MRAIGATLPKNRKPGKTPKSTVVAQAENVLAARLRMIGVPFRRNRTIGFYRVGFVFRRKLLIVEVDPDGDGSGRGRTYDLRRDGWLRAAGYNVIRVEAANVPSLDLSVITDSPNLRREEIARAAGRVGSWFDNAMSMKKARRQRLRHGSKRPGNVPSFPEGSHLGECARGR